MDQAGIDRFVQEGHIVHHSGDQVACLTSVEIAHGKRMEMFVDLVPEVFDDPLFHIGQEKALCIAEEVLQEEGDQDNQTDALERIFARAPADPAIRPRPQFRLYPVRKIGLCGFLCALFGKLFLLKGGCLWYLKDVLQKRHHHPNTSAA